MLETLVERATQYSAARRLVENDAEYASALALLAIHSAISWNDAVLWKLQGRLTKSKNHMDAVRSTQEQCDAKKLGSGGIKHLRALIGDKTDVTYGRRRLTLKFAQTLATTAERFEAWANGLLKELR